MRHVIYTFDKVSMISTGTTSSPVTQIVANRYLQYTQDAPGYAAEPSAPARAPAPCAFSRRNQVASCWAAAVSQISRGAFATHSNNNV